MAGDPTKLHYSHDFAIYIYICSWYFLLRRLTVAGDETSVYVVLKLVHVVHKGNLLLLTLITWKILVLQ